jgi:hypothetical protein
MSTAIHDTHVVESLKDIKQSQQEMKEDIGALKLSMNTIQTLFNGGPGHWDACVSHKETILDHEKRIRALYTRMILITGGAFVFMFFVSLYQPKIQEFLHIIK